MNLLFLISVIVIFCFVIMFIFDPMINKNFKKQNFLSSDDKSLKRIFLNKQMKALELDFSIGNIDFDEYKRKKKDLEIHLSNIK